MPEYIQNNSSNNSNSHGHESVANSSNGNPDGADHLLWAARARLASEPEIRAEQVDSLRKSIANHTYKVPLNTLILRLLRYLKLTPR